MLDEETGESALGQHTYLLYENLAVEARLEGTRAEARVTAALDHGGKLAGNFAFSNLTAAAPGLLCRAAVAAAERANGIPAHLLAAISRVESGRRDPITGDWHPWPWTVNAEGQGYFYDTKAQAVAAVRDMQSHGIQSIDVGCGQVNLMHHPDAFASLDLAFDPQVNAAYAGKFLKELFDQTGDWTKAVAEYHSATPAIGADYQRKVLAVWPEESRIAGSFGGSALAHAWGATMEPAAQVGPSGFRPGARTIMMPATAGGVAVGRGLAAYRAAPVRLALQPPPPRTGLRGQ